VPVEAEMSLLEDFTNIDIKYIDAAKECGDDDVADLVVATLMSYKGDLMAALYCHQIDRSVEFTSGFLKELRDDPEPLGETLGPIAVDEDGEVTLDPSKLRRTKGD